MHESKKQNNFKNSLKVKTYFLPVTINLYLITIKFSALMVPIVCRSAAWESLAEEVNTQELVTLAEDAYEM
jgi:hypothetical protein